MSIHRRDKTYRRVQHRSNKIYIDTEHEELSDLSHNLVVGHLIAEMGHKIPASAVRSRSNTHPNLSRFRYDLWNVLRLLDCIGDQLLELERDSSRSAAAIDE